MSLLLIKCLNCSLLFFSVVLPLIVSVAKVQEVDAYAALLLADIASLNLLLSRLLELLSGFGFAFLLLLRAAEMRLSSNVSQSFVASSSASGPLEEYLSHRTTVKLLQISRDLNQLLVLVFFYPHVLVEAVKCDLLDFEEHDLEPLLRSSCEIDEEPISVSVVLHLPKTLKGVKPECH